MQEDTYFLTVHEQRRLQAPFKLGFLDCPRSAFNVPRPVPVKMGEVGRRRGIQMRIAPEALGLEDSSYGTFAFKMQDRASKCKSTAYLESFHSRFQAHSATLEDDSTQ